MGGSICCCIGGCICDEIGGGCMCGNICGCIGIGEYICGGICKLNRGCTEGTCPVGTTRPSGPGGHTAPSSGPSKLCRSRSPGRAPSRTTPHTMVTSSILPPWKGFPSSAAATVKGVLTAGSFLRIPMAIARLAMLTASRFTEFCAATGSAPDSTRICSETHA